MKNVIYILSCLAIVLSFCNPVMAGGKVLVVHSYYSDFAWVNELTEGIQKGLEGTEAQIEIFYMDTKRKTSEEWKVEAGELAKQKVAEFQPDVVIPTDDDAQQYFAKDYVGQERPAIVFAGVNKDPAAKYGYPASNATGVRQKPLLVPTLELLKMIKADIQTVAVLCGSGPGGDALLAYFKTQVPPIEVVSYGRPSTFDEWKASIKEYQNSADSIMVMIYDKFKTPEGKLVDPQEVMDWTISNTQIPVVGVQYGAQQGALCSIAESGVEQGFQAGRIAAQILEGKKPSDFPLVTPTRGIVMLNLKTAQALGVVIPFEVIESAEVIIE